MLCPPCAVFGGKGGGAADTTSRLGGGGGTEPLLGGGGGADDLRSPWKAGGTRKPVDGSSSWIGVLGGLGGGGGPGFAKLLGFDTVLARPVGPGPWDTANLPASASGGGARNLGCGLEGGDGDGSGGDSGLGGEGGLPPTGLRDGGGAGGAPLLLDVLDNVAPVFCGLTLDDGADGGGGGGAALPDIEFLLLVLPMASAIPVAVSCACFCSTYCRMKSAFCAIWSSVMPICTSSSSIGRQVGSARSIPELLGRLFTWGGEYAD